ncbi:hypothetical protein [Candidatus Laterigemmans baculatus]|uniref:hypothetical protein n=1 Tax=Candidatus Laterigemmans baculatus TaxID=2770505 RepID=UPI0013DA980A|nr:hypothetical protein [Candidatus Laterigemmans baculatus]
MAIRRSLFLSLAAAAITVGGGASSAVAQQGPTATPHEVTDGLILSADDFALAPGETLVDGGPGVTLAPEAHAGPAHAGHGHPHGHAPLFPPGSEMAMGMPCPTCEPGHYATVEAIYVKHDESRGLLGDDLFLRSNDFDYEWAGRLTLGRRFDCVNGYEFVYTGPLEWEMDGTANFTTVDGDVALAQRFEARMNSLEFNRTYFGWDVVKATHGIRAVFYEENAALNRVTNPADAINDYQAAESVDNFLIGPQAGLELYYPLSNRFFVGGKLQGAVFANFVESDTFVDSNAFDNVRDSRDDVDISGMFELGTNLGVHITESVSATIGYDMWYLIGVGTSHHRIPDTLTFRDVRANDEVFMHGATAGIQVQY